MPMPHTLTARRLITAHGEIEFPVVTLSDDGHIADISSDPIALANAQDILVPASFDIHTHGAMGHDVMSASPADLGEMQRFLGTRGVARYLPTTVTAPVDLTLRALESLANAIEAEPHPGEAQPMGIHLEGPFLSHAKRGVHPTSQLQTPSIELFDRFYEAARGHILLMTVAPELPGAKQMIAHAISRGVKVSLGHTNATYAEALTGVAAGATTATHTFNAMRALDHREPGVLGLVLDDDRLFAELICDGIHVAPEIVRLWWKAKGPERAILVTDAMAAAGMPDGDYSLGELGVVVSNGRALLREDLTAGKETLAGSVLTMDRAIENFARFTSASAADAARLASSVPATMLGQLAWTEPRSGAPANLNRLDAKGRLLETYLHGRRIQLS